MSAFERMKQTFQAMAGPVPDSAKVTDCIPFLVLNPGYEETLFLSLPRSFVAESLMAPLGITDGDVVDVAHGRLITVTEKAVVLTVLTARRMVHVIFNGPGLQQCAVRGPSLAMTMARLKQRAEEEGWVVSTTEHSELLANIALRRQLKVALALWRGAGPVQEA